ncbi:hypothetical protein [Micromonospora sp. Llam0]|uniref:hypothetical protein n=1 Tax=Micromonospora sp. Llam0 TaxID=2485143 RepID=UPI001315A956|nr:hypothetical protein [Micromonospora sp. Llam0]
MEAENQVGVTADVAVADESASDQPQSLPKSLRKTLMEIAVGVRPKPEDLAEGFNSITDLRPPARDIVLGTLMTALMAGGPRVGDVVAFLRSALSLDRRPPPQEVRGAGRPVLTLAGSGKKGRRTLNVSTPAALVAAAAGAQIIKVGSAATSSALGSRELVHALGLPECRTAESVRDSLAASGIAFVAIEPEIPLLDGLYGGRFHAPNPFSFGLAPLASPVRGDITVFGLSHPRVDVAASVLGEFGMDQVEVLSSRLPTGEYLDEIAPVGHVLSCRVWQGRPGLVRRQPAHELVGAAGIDIPQPSGRGEAIERVGDLLAGGGLREHRVMVAANAGYLLVRSGIAASPSAGMAVADDILRSGAALANLSRARTVKMRGA